MAFMRGRGGSAGLAAWLLLGPAAAHGQYNPDGWIQTDGWNYLLPLRGPGCDGGGPESMLRNWVAPHDVGREDPRAGDVWADIDFGGAAASPGFAGDPGLGPTWFTNAYLAARFPGVTWPNSHLVSFQSLADVWNGQNESGEPLAGLADLASDNVLAVATTYIRNPTEADLPVLICTASDDSIQVLLNDCTVINFSHCAPEHDCDGVADVLLPTGVSRLAVLVWEGGGGWSFRLSVRDPRGVRHDDTSAELDFLGPEVDEPVSEGTCCEASPDHVAIAGKSQAAVGRSIVLQARMLGADGPATYSWGAAPGGIAAVTGRDDGTAEVECFDAGQVTVMVTANDGLCAGAMDTHFLECANLELTHAGDENQDGRLDIADPVAVLNHLFGPHNPTLPCGDGTFTDAANVAFLDVNGTGSIDIADPVYLLNFLFSGGPLPQPCEGGDCCIHVIGCPAVPCLDD
jgi:hypothetical protein